MASNKIKGLITEGDEIKGFISEVGDVKGMVTEGEAKYLCRHSDERIAIAKAMGEVAKAIAKVKRGVALNHELSTFSEMALEQTDELRNILNTLHTRFLKLEKEV